MCVCMCLAKFTHFKLFICGAQLNRSRVGRFLACCKCTEQNLHFDCPECKHKELVCVSLCVSQMVCVYVRLCQGGGFEKKKKERRKPAWELAPFGGNACEKLKLRRVISSIPECSGSGERRGGKVGKEEARREGAGLSSLPFEARTYRVTHTHTHTHTHSK